MGGFGLQLVEGLGGAMDSVGVDHSNRGQLYDTIVVQNYLCIQNNAKI